MRSPRGRGRGDQGACPGQASLPVFRGPHPVRVWRRKPQDWEGVPYGSKGVLQASTLSEGFPGGSEGKESACNAGDPGLIPGSGRCAGGGHATPSRIIVWSVPWTEELGGLQSTGSQRVRHD